MKISLYSAIYGEYDVPKPIPQGLGIPTVLYTDSKITRTLADQAGWDIVLRTGTRGSWSDVEDLPEQWDSLTPMMKHKWWKMHPALAFEDLETHISLWIDGSMTINADYVAKCVDALGDDDWVMIKHPVRDCIYDEADFSATMTWKYDPIATKEQARIYREQGHPEHWGLFATGANVRRHTPAALAFGQGWWKHNVKYTHQDQISLPVLLRNAGDTLKWNTNMPWHEWWQLAEHNI